MGERRGPERHPDTQVVEFNGITYTRRPGRRYFKTMRWDKEAKRYRADALHRAVWRFHYGEIPDGHDVHHLDGNWDNNDIANLDCIPEADHVRGHDPFATFNGTARHGEHIRRISRLSWEKAVYKTYSCVQCGEQFQSRRSHPPRFCSKSCCGRFSYLKRKAGRLRPPG